jgi:outer membrane biosynthesis protein TonB
MDRQFYQWSAGGATVNASVSADSIVRLRQVIRSSNDAEVGGLLLGRRESDDRITIEDFEILPSEHRRGLTFTLSQADRRKLIQRLRAKHHGLEVVGTFRSHLRQGLYMDQYDFDLMQSSFAGITDVMMLVRPSDWTAGLFVWEQGDIQRQKSYREFPFDIAQLPMTMVDTPAARVPALRKSWSLPPAWLASAVSPTVVKLALLAVTVGLVAVLGHYSHGRQAGPSTEVAMMQLAPDVSGEIQRPVDPDVARSDVDEMHVKLPPVETRPSPFAENRPQPVPTPAASGSSVRSSVQPAEVIVQPQLPAPPAPMPPVQMAGNVPASLSGPVALKPEPPQLISVVSVQAAQPGAVSRGINRIPILNLLQRNKYKAGDRFLPARPVRQVKPRLSAEWASANGYPSPVDVKVWVDENGRVTRAQPLSGESEPEIADMASNAAMKWTFEPARIADRPVSSEVVMHFRFAERY